MGAINSHYQLLLAAAASGNADAIEVWNALATGDWWTLNSAADPNIGAKNSTSAGKIGTGATTATAFKKGNGVDFTPNALYRATTLPWTPASTLSLSMGCWVNPDSIATVCPMVVGHTASNNGNARCLQMFLMSTGALKARTGNTIIFTDADTSTGLISTGNTYFLQAQITASTGVLRCRVNNGTWTSVSTGSSNAVPVTSIGISIGGDYNSGSSTHLNSYDGRIDEAFVVPAALSDAAWDYLYAAGSGKSFAEVQSDSGH